MTTLADNFPDAQPRVTVGVSPDGVDAVTPLHDPMVWVLPLEFTQAGAITGKPYPAYSTVLEDFDDYEGVAGLASYESFMQGHPGFPGGVPELPSGTGVVWGAQYRGVEWWLTDAEGLDDSAPWEATTNTNATQDGSWLLGVTSAGREITLRGSLVADTPTAMRDAKSLASACLAVRPRTGWLTYANDRRISVALAGPVKMKHLGPRLVEVEQSFRGVDVGTPGAGVYFESPSTTRWQASLTAQVQVNDGDIPTYPVITIAGPVPAGTQLWIGQTGLELTTRIARGQRLVIDSRLRRVTINGEVSRTAIEVFHNRWPIVAPGANTVALKNSNPEPGGAVYIDVTRLW